jgi:hypothetical protein
VYMLLIGKPEGKSPLERQKNRWVEIIKTGRLDIGWLVWTGLVELRMGKSVELL